MKVTIDPPKTPITEGQQSIKIMPSKLDPADLEPELEALLLRWVPDMRSQWRSADAEDIEAIERIAGGELPRCYRWFLLRLGEGWQTLGFGMADFSARSIVEGHARGLFPSREGMICIANDEPVEQPQRRYYDLAHPAKDDAPVYVAGPENADFVLEYETLRELIGSSVFDNYRVHAMPFQCSGVLAKEDDGDVLEALTPLFEELGFRKPIPCGPWCLIYDNGTLSFSSYRNPERQRRHVLPFQIGGPSIGDLRKLLGMLATSAGLAAEDLEWTP